MFIFRRRVSCIAACGDKWAGNVPGDYGVISNPVTIVWWLSIGTHYSFCGVCRPDSLLDCPSGNDHQIGIQATDARDDLRGMR